jgi:hypothetical protein
LDDLSVGDRGVLKSTTTTVLEFIYAFKSFRVCLMKLGVYRLIIISFWCISLFISMERLLFHLINVGLKSTLSNTSTATPVCFRGPVAFLNLLPAFQPQAMLASVDDMGLL